MTAREPVFHLNYPGHAEHTVNQVVGPNSMGEEMVVVWTSYREDTDTTRVGLTYATKADVERRDNAVLEQVERARTADALIGEL